MHLNRLQRPLGEQLQGAFGVDHASAGDVLGAVGGKPAAEVITRARGRRKGRQRFAGGVAGGTCSMMAITGSLKKQKMGAVLYVWMAPQKPQQKRKFLTSGLKILDNDGLPQTLRICDRAPGGW